VDAATLLAEHTQALDAVLLRLRALEQERQQLVNQAAHLQGGIAALQELLDAEASRMPQAPSRVPDVSQGISGVDHVPVAASGA
jgi:hypothetical protein